MSYVVRQNSSCHKSAVINVLYHVTVLTSSDNVDVLQHGADIVLVRVSNLGPTAIAVVFCVVLCFLVL